MRDGALLGVINDGDVADGLTYRRLSTFHAPPRLPVPSASSVVRLDFRSQPR